MNGAELESDHDTIIRLNTNVINMCKKLEQFHKENRDDHTSIVKALEIKTKDLEDKLLHKLDTSLFKWVIGFIILALISLATYTVDNTLTTTTNVTNNTNNIETINKKIK